MAINPLQLLDLAQREADPGVPGAPRQVDLRRAVSTAYYALFHALCGAIADEFAGTGGGNYARAKFYRALDHAGIPCLHDGALRLGSGQPLSRKNR